MIGRDGADARFVSKLWRSLLYRDAGPSIAVTRSAQLEHRAYMLLMAAKVGVPVSEVVIADLGRARRTPRSSSCSTPTGDRSRSSTPTASVTPRSTTRGTNLVRLHDARLSHGQLGAVNVLVLRRRVDGVRRLLAGFRGGARRSGACAIGSTCSPAPPRSSATSGPSTPRCVPSVADGIEAVLPMMETAALVARRQARRSPSPRSSSRASARPGRR